MNFSLSAVDAEVQDYGLPFHPLLSDSEGYHENIIEFLMLGVLNLRKFFLGGKFTRANFCRNLYSEEKAAHMILTFQL